MCDSVRLLFFFFFFSLETPTRCSRGGGCRTCASGIFSGSLLEGE